MSLSAGVAKSTLTVLVGGSLAVTAWLLPSRLTPQVAATIHGESLRGVFGELTLEHGIEASAGVFVNDAPLSTGMGDVPKYVTFALTFRYLDKVLHEAVGAKPVDGNQGTTTPVTLGIYSCDLATVSPSLADLGILNFKVTAKPAGAQTWVTLPEDAVEARQLIDVEYELLP